MNEVLVDANVLLRYLTVSPRHLADRAAILLETAERLRCTLVIPPLIVAEVVYILGSVYEWPRREIRRQASRRALGLCPLRAGA